MIRSLNRAPSIVSRKPISFLAPEDKGMRTGNISRPICHIPAQRRVVNGRPQNKFNRPQNQQAPQRRLDKVTGSGFRPFWNCRPLCPLNAEVDTQNKQRSPGAERQNLFRLPDSLRAVQNYRPQKPGSRQQKLQTKDKRPNPTLHAKRYLSQTANLLSKQTCENLSGDYTLPALSEFRLRKSGRFNLYPSAFILPSTYAVTASRMNAASCGCMSSKLALNFGSSLYMPAISSSWSRFGVQK